MPREQRDKERARWLNPEPGQSLSESVRRRPPAFRALRNRPLPENGHAFDWLA